MISQKIVLSNGGERATDDEIGSVNQILLRADEVADMLQISRSQVFEMARRNEIPCVRIGRLVRYPAQEIRQWVDRQIIRPR